jgi:hypothetical protein
MQIRYGSVIELADGTIWYGCGTWHINGLSEYVPAMLGYVPITLAKPSPEAKILDRAKQQFWKVFDLEWSLYHSILSTVIEPYFQAVGLGKIVFIPMCLVTNVRDPYASLPRHLQHLPRQQDALNALVFDCGIAINDVGISGSSLVLPVPTYRHELDIVIKGEDNALRFRRHVNALIEAGLVGADAFFSQRVIYNGVCLDPHFDLRDTDEHLLSDAMIRFEGCLSTHNGKVMSSGPISHFPYLWSLDCGSMLLSVKSGHQELLKVGNRFRASNLEKACISKNGTEISVLIAGSTSWIEKIPDA